MSAIYRPSARVTLAFRFEEYADDGSLIERLQSAADQPPEPATATRQDPVVRDEIPARVDQVQDAITRLIQAPGDRTQTQIETDVAALRSQRDGLIDAFEGTQGALEPPPALGGTSSPDGRTTIGGILPKSVTIERNSINTADKATVTLDARDVPFDPRLIRACGIEITIGVIDPRDYEAGVSGARAEDGTLTSMVGRSRTLAGPEARLQNTTRFVGWVDTWQIAYDESDGDELVIECRDLSALLFDTPLATGSGIDLTLPIDQGISALLETYPGLRGIQVVYGRPGASEPATAPVPSRAAPVTLSARRGRTRRQRRSQDQTQDLWSHVTETCARVGVLPVFYDYQLHVIEPRTLYSSEVGTVRRMVYGRNLRHLEWTRKIGGVKVPTIEVRCFDPDLGRTRWARYPSPDGQPDNGILGVSDPPRGNRSRRPNEPQVAGHAPTERINTILVRGVSDGTALARIARQAFEQIGRQEIEGSWTTDDLRSFEPSGPLSAQDLLALDAGDPVELLISGGPNVPSVAGLSASQVQSLTRTARADYLRLIGWGQDVAQRFAELQDALANQTTFRTQNVRLSWDADEGVTVVADFINYIEVRESPGPADQQQAVAQVQTDRALPATVQQEVAGRADNPNATALTDLYRERSELTDRLEAGTISQEEYDTRVAVIDEEIPAQRLLLEGGGIPLPST